MAQMVPRDQDGICAICVICDPWSGASRWRGSETTLMPPVAPLHV